MGFFTNLRLRRKLLIAMVPLALMVVAAGVYSSFESKTIDTWYSVLIDTQVKALRSVGEARAHTNRFGLFLFELADETDPDRRQVIDGQLEKVGADFHTAMQQHSKRAPSAQRKSTPHLPCSNRRKLTLGPSARQPWPATMRKR